MLTKRFDPKFKSIPKVEKQITIPIALDPKILSGQTESDKVELSAEELKEILNLVGKGRSLMGDSEGDFSVDAELFDIPKFQKPLSKLYSHFYHASKGKAATPEVKKSMMDLVRFYHLTKTLKNFNELWGAEIPVEERNSRNHMILVLESLFENTPVTSKVFDVLLKEKIIKHEQYETARKVWKNMI